MAASTPSLKTLLGDWRKLLTDWASSGQLTAAAQDALQLKGEPELLKRLAGQWSKGDFSGLPPIVLLPSSSMPGAAGAYAISTRTIYLNQDWLKTASHDRVMSVLTEELGHHLDGMLNTVDTPGDEGRDIARRLFSASSANAKGLESSSHGLDDTCLVFLGKKAIIAEASTIVVPVEDDWPADSSTAGVLRPGTPTGGEFYPYQDKDWFRMDLEKGVNYVIEGSMGYPKVPSMAVLTVGPTGETRVIKTNSIGTPQYPRLNNTIPFSPETTGRYYLSVSGGGSGEDYWLNMRIVAPDWSDRDIMPPSVSSMTVNGSSLTLILNETLKTTIPQVARFRILVDGAIRDVTRGTVDASGKAVTLQLASPTSYGQRVTLSYTDKTSGNDNADVIEDVAGNDLESFAATNVVNSSKPPLQKESSPKIRFSSMGANNINKINEGERLTIEVFNANPRRDLYFSIRGDISDQDMELGISSDTGGQKLNGKITTDANGYAKFSRFVSLDKYTEGEEELRLRLFGDRLYSNSSLIAESSLIITDISKTKIETAVKHESRYISSGSIILAEGTQIAAPEGASVYTSATVKGIKDGTTVYWQLEPWGTSGFTSADIKGSSLRGSSVISSGGNFSLSYQLNTDEVEESDEKFYLRIYEDSSLSKEIPSVSTAPIVTINDLKIDKTAPRIKELVVNGLALKITLDESIASTQPDLQRIQLFIDGISRGIQRVATNGKDGRVELLLSSPALYNQRVTLSYTDKSVANDTSGVIEDVAGNDLASFTARAVSNITAPVNNEMKSFTSAKLTGSGPSSLILTGTNPVDASGDQRNNSITGNSNNNRLYGDLGKDTLTGGGISDSDIFSYTTLKESALDSYDVITDFTIRDKINAPSSVLNNEPYRLTGPQRNIEVLNAEYLAATFDRRARIFYPGSVVSFTVSDKAGTFIAMNDNRHGFQADSDAIIHLQNYSISPSNYVDFI